MPLSVARLSPVSCQACSLAAPGDRQANIDKIIKPLQASPSFTSDTLTTLLYK